MGKTVRLASNLTGWDIDILTEAEESERRQEEFRTRSEMFMEALDVDDVIAHLLVTEGFTTVDEVAYVPIEELAMIEGFEEDLAVELSSRAAAYVEAMNKELNERRIELGVSDEIAAIEGLDPAILVALGENDVKTLDDLGDLAGDELIEILGDLAPSIEEANAVIMMARAHWFDDEEPMDGAEAGDAGEAAEAGDAAEDRRRGARETQRLTASAHMQDRPASPDAGSRRCIASGASKPRDTLLRFVVDPAGALVPDLGESLPGRGLWVSAERAALEKACERGLFARAARRPIAVAPDLIDEVGAAVDRAVAGHSRASTPRRRAGHWLRQGAASAHREARCRPGRGERRRAPWPGPPRRARAGYSRNRAIRWRRVEPQPGGVGM